jgi:hypothetical protein
LPAAHSGEADFDLVRPFATEASTNVLELLDWRGWEIVSPFEKPAAPARGPE